MEFEKRIEKIPDLLQTVIQDPVIKKRIISVLQLSSFERSIVLDNWLEQLRLRDASNDLLIALCCLFDDKITEEVLAFIHDPKIIGANINLQKTSEDQSKSH